MKRLILLMLLGSVLVPHLLFAETLEEFGNQMSTFYLAPTREGFDRLQKNADRFYDQLQGAGNGAEILVGVMIAKISAKHHWPIADGALGPKAKEILAGQSALARYLTDDSRVDPTKLDVWWAGFFATGEERYLENIFRYAGREIPQSDVKERLIVGAATWSFKSNCAQHAKVLEFARRKANMKSLSADRLTYLKDCIAFAESADGAPIRTRGTPEGAHP